jgi:lipoic acid synthetase
MESPEGATPAASPADAPASSPSPLHVGKPAWLKTPIPTGGAYFRIKRDLRERTLYTVCEEAKCPNINHCWNEETATFMVLGDTCTRGCRFCNVKTGNPSGWLDADEPRKTGEAAAKMGLRYVVLTMVDRDDLADGGAAHVAEVIRELRAQTPGLRVETLVGDFNGRDACHAAVLAERPEVYAHNLETVERLTPRVRDARADYRQSLAVLGRAKQLADYGVFTKSGLMLGLGETEDEVVATLRELRAVGCDFLTLGQYMRPSKKHLSIKRWVPPEEFDRLGRIARELGFRSVASSPLVRSSYRAASFYADALAATAPERAAGTEPR